MSGPSWEAVQGAHLRRTARSAALKAVAESIREYAKGMYANAYGDMRQYEQGCHIEYHFGQLANHLDRSALDIANASGILKK